MLKIGKSGATVLVRIETPTGSSGVSTNVSLQPLTAAATSGAAVEIPGSSGRDLFIELRDEQFYLWIQGVGANGWSILVPEQGLRDALGYRWCPEASFN
ncbi:MAG: hypothetical protein JNL28_00805 [Planctomycetes bacterium]|nr:hypothetical protein [Planctomycetota bacterium]